LRSDRPCVSLLFRYKIGAAGAWLAASLRRKGRG